MAELETVGADPRGLQRRFLLLALIAFIPLTLLLGFLGKREYDREVATVLAARDAAVKARQIEIEGLVAVTRSEVVMLASALAADLALPWADAPLPAAFDLGIGDRVLLLNRRPDAERGERHGTLVGIPTAVSARDSSRTELAAIDRLFPVQAATHAANSTFRFTYYLSASRDLMAVYPWTAPEVLLGPAAGRNAAFAALFESEVFRGSGEAGRAPFWTGLRQDFGRQIEVVTFAAPVEVREVRRGVVAADVDAGALRRMIGAIELPGTIAALVDAAGRPLVTSASRVSGGPALPLSPDDVKAMPPGFDGVLRDLRVAAVAIEGSPWRILVTTPEATIANAALAAAAPFALAIAGVVVSLALVMLLLHRELIRPAVHLAAFTAAEARGETLDLPAVPTAWRGLADRIAEASKDREALVRQQRAMIDGIPLRAVYLDHTYTYRDANREFLAFTGVERDQLVGRTVREVLGPEVEKQYIALTPTIRRGEVARFEGWIDYPAPHGRRYLQVSILPFRPPEAPEAGFLTFTRDLTDQKQAEADVQRNIEALERSEALNRSVVISALDAIIIMDDDGNTLDFNPAAEALFGYTHDEAMGRPVGELIVPEGARQAHRHGMDRYLATGVAHVIGRRVEVDGQRKDGTLVPVELTVTEMRMGGRRVFVSHLRDLTESRERNREINAQREKLHQAEKMTAMGSLLAGVAHELNNPLAVVVAHATLLEEQAQTEDLKRRAQRIHAAAERCARIIKTFLAMARQQAPTRTRVALDTVVEKALSVTIYNLRTSGIAVEQHYEPDMPPVDADADQLAQVISNLLINAQQAMVGSTGPHRVRIEGGTLANGRAFLRIADNGPGVPAHLRERIFEAFFTTKPVGVGTGIGLSVCRNIVKAHAGQLTLEDTARGASFLIDLPAAAPLAAGQNPAARSLMLKGYAVLVVDDEPDVGSILAEILEGRGAATAFAQSRAEALALIDRQRFDLVMSDLRMPDGGGLELWRDLATRGDVLADRFIIVTGDTVAGPALIAAADRPGQVRPLILEKPFLPADVEQRVAEALELER